MTTNIPIEKIKENLIESLKHLIPPVETAEVVRGVKEIGIMNEDAKNLMLPTPFAKHLRKRGLTPEIRCWISWEEEIVRFPLWTLGNGKLLGYSRYNWKAPKLRSNAEGGRYINKANSAYCMLWGLEHFYASETLFVVEGVWDAIRIINAGYAAVAALTATPSKGFVGYFKLITRGRPIIVLGDNDENGAGRKLGKLGRLVIPPAEDMGAMTQDEANLFLKKCFKIEELRSNGQKEI